MKKLMIMMLLGMIILLAACDSVDVSKVSDEDLQRIANTAIVCNEPYIRHGTGCCLDKDSNNICDVDEGKIDEEQWTPPKEEHRPKDKEDNFCVFVEEDEEKGQELDRNNKVVFNSYVWEYECDGENEVSFIRYQPETVDSKRFAKEFVLQIEEEYGVLHEVNDNDEGYYYAELDIGEKYNYLIAMWYDQTYTYAYIIENADSLSSGAEEFITESFKDYMNKYESRMTSEFSVDSAVEPVFERGFELKDGFFQGEMNGCASEEIDYYIESFSSGTEYTAKLMEYECSGEDISFYMFGASIDKETLLREIVAEINQDYEYTEVEVESTDFDGKVVEVETEEILAYLWFNDKYVYVLSVEDAEEMDQDMTQVFVKLFESYFITYQSRVYAGMDLVSKAQDEFFFDGGFYQGEMKNCHSRSPDSDSSDELEGDKSLGYDIDSISYKCDDAYVQFLMVDPATVSAELFMSEFFRLLEGVEEGIEISNPSEDVIRADEEGANTFRVGWHDSLYVYIMELNYPSTVSDDTNEVTDFLFEKYREKYPGQPVDLIDYQYS